MYTEHYSQEIESLATPEFDAYQKLLEKDEDINEYGKALSNIKEEQNVIH